MEDEIINTAVNPKEFEYVKSLSWNEVFSMWREGETTRKSWVEHYKDKGFNSWEEWRTTEIIKPLDLEKKEWELYEILNPLKSIPSFHGGPFKSWVEKFYNDRTQPTFAELAEHHGIQGHTRINQIMRNFPKESLLIALTTPGGIVVLEGMHRCCAIALAFRQNTKIEATINIALGSLAK